MGLDVSTLEEASAAEKDATRLGQVCICTSSTVSNASPHDMHTTAPRRLLLSFSWCFFLLCESSVILAGKAREHKLHRNGFWFSEWVRIW